MKTTIDVNGHQIVIDVSEEAVSVSALKMGEEGEEEVVEEFTLDLVEGEEGEDFDDLEGDDDIKGFGDFDEEEDFDGEEDLEGEDLEGGEDFDEEDLEDETKLESYQSFIDKNK